MERHEIIADSRMADWVDALARGDEVVIVRDGKIVAEVKAPAKSRIRRAQAIDIAGLEELRSRLPVSRGSGAALVREIRDAPDW
jgi:antitoxin (DNA-binding transcriptional repressor) of toxin-antitoxin stability system